MRRRGWYHGWNIVAAFAVSQAAVISLTFTSFSLFVIDWSREFGVPVSKIALVMTAYSLSSLVIMPLSGVLTDRFSVRWLLGLGIAGVAAMYCLMGLTTQYWQFIALYVLLPIAVGPTVIPGQSLVTRWFQRRRGLAMALTAFGNTMGGVIFPPLIVILLPLVGWRWVFWLTALLLVLVILPVTVLACRGRPRADELGSYVTDAVENALPPTLGFRDILARRNFWVTIGAFLCASNAFVALTVIMAPLVLSLGHGPSLAAWLLALMSISALISKLVAGFVFDRSGNRLPMAVLPILCGSGMILFAVTPSSVVALNIAIIMVGAAGGLWTVLGSSMAVEFGPADFGRAFGMICALTSLTTFAPPVFAWMNEVSGSYFSGLTIFGGIAIAGGLLPVFFYQHSRQRRPHAGPDILG